MPNHSAQVTAAEIARLAAVTRATVSNWRRRHPDFPTPAGGTEASPAYDLEAVLAWLAARGQLPNTSPADDLRAALRRPPADATAPGRLRPLVLAAARLAGSERDKLIDLPDDRLAQHAQQIVRTCAGEVPGADEVTYRAAEADMVRALLRCLREEGGLTTVDVLAERETDDSSASGAYETPKPLAALMADLLAGASAVFPANVFDPACGAGNLLREAARRGARELYGQDLVASQAAQAAVRLGLTTPTAISRIEAGDSLRADAFPALAAEAVLCAPPYGDRDWGHEELAYDPRWVYGLPPKGEPELAWVQHCLAHLKPDGFAVLLMPPATAERAAGRRIRAQLLRSGALRAVIALPSGAAAPLHVGLHLWLLQRPHPQASIAQSVLLVDTAGAVEPNTRQSSPGPATRRTPLDWSPLRDTVLDTWRAYAASPDDFQTVPGTARAVPVIDLLDETVDLTPARHVRAVPVTAKPDEFAETARALRGRLRRAAADLANVSGGEDWPPAGDESRSWRTATVADLLRGGALTLLRASTTGRGAAAAQLAEVQIQPGDVILPEMLHTDSGSARVAGPEDAGQPLGRHLYLLHPDPERLDPWFLAGFLAAEENLHAAATGSSIVRVDARRLRVPLLPLAEQRRYSTAFRHLAALRSAADLAGRLADETARALASGLTGGALLPPDVDPGPSRERRSARAPAQKERREPE